MSVFWGVVFCRASISMQYVRSKTLAKISWLISNIHYNNAVGQFLERLEKEHTIHNINTYSVFCAFDFPASYNSSFQIPRFFSTAINSTKQKLTVLKFSDL